MVARIDRVMRTAGKEEGSTLLDQPAGQSRQGCENRCKTHSNSVVGGQLGSCTVPVVNVSPEATCSRACHHGQLRAVRAMPLGSWHIWRPCGGCPFTGLGTTPGVGCASVQTSYSHMHPTHRHAWVEVGTSAKLYCLGDTPVPAHRSTKLKQRNVPRKGAPPGRKLFILVTF